jgi:hypothetical protein
MLDVRKVPDQLEACEHRPSALHALHRQHRRQGRTGGGVGLLLRLADQQAHIARLVLGRCGASLFPDFLFTGFACFARAA